MAQTDADNLIELTKTLNTYNPYTHTPGAPLEMSETAAKYIAEFDKAIDLLQQGSDKATIYEQFSLMVKGAREVAATYESTSNALLRIAYRGTADIFQDYIDEKEPRAGNLYTLKFNPDNTVEKESAQQVAELLKGRKEMHLNDYTDPYSRSLDIFLSAFNRADRRFIQGDYSVLTAFAPFDPEWTPYLQEVIPQLNEEIRADSNLPEDEIISLIYYTTERGKDPNTGEKLPDYIEIARSRAKELYKKEHAFSVTAQKAEIVEYPLDKINQNIWSLLEEDTGGQIRLAAEKTGTKKELNILYSIDFEALGDNVKISKRLTQFDKRVYNAVSTLFNAGNNIMTLTQIYAAMGNTGKPSKNQLAKINDSITKMRNAAIMVNNEQEAATYNYTKFVYDGALLPLERCTAIINGQMADAAIRVFREPPVQTFAKERKQITTFSIKLLQSPINKTEANLAIEDYLIERIARAKKGGQPHKILLKTLYEKTGNTTYKQKERAAAKVKTYLDHYKRCAFISGYKLTKDSITVHF